MSETLFLELFVYIATGAVVGFSAGLLGIGGGLIIGIDRSVCRGDGEQAG